MLREVLYLFGNAIPKSLERTMGKYLENTGGIYRSELRDEWELEAQLYSKSRSRLRLKPPAANGPPPVQSSVRLTPHARIASQKTSNRHNAGVCPFPFVRAFRGGCTSGNQTLQTHRRPPIGWDVWLRTQNFTAKHPNLLPLTLSELLTDLTWLQRSLGFMTQTRAGLMTRDPRGKYVVENPRVGWTNERHTSGLILHVLTERPPDVLKRPKY
jgi:hypothetical protein